ncbi:hypothetical protein [Rhizobium sp. WYJ-E13]|uniref:hypothetical protein n=1 Tax=Rhizobium sp. WYJ-E13 TaxID=2849093 RepID=UPI001C1ED8BA|nr:hypothetical protein [Rhizobium sp. WYJ-E13]QWW72590.1 hypothetical protein KQ933_32305 [Rhizobium sp. WYJ-E13]
MNLFALHVAPTAALDIMRSGVANEAVERNATLASQSSVGRALESSYAPVGFFFGVTARALGLIASDCDCNLFPAIKNGLLTLLG